MSAKHVNPTRMGLTRLKEELATAIHGYKLLKDRRDELMRQFLGLVRESKAPRERVEADIVATNQDFVLTCSDMTDEVLNVALMAPKQEVYLETETKNVMNVGIPVFKYKIRISGPNDIYSYDFIFTSSDLDDAIKNLADLLPDMLRLVECEKSYQLMAARIEKTRRRVNALEHVMIPDIQLNIRYITMRLDESKRSSQIGPMRVKDMMPEEAHHYSEREVVPVIDEVQQASS